ncbi:MAG: hypothetical protein FWC83_00645 [Alphaproteobacteria bacterium]|nr:hypothetical protein [Alphaproteobacteria bacterium]
MRKLLFATLALALAFATTACSSSRTIYQGDVRFTQHRNACVAEMNQRGDIDDVRFRESRRVRHANAQCIDLIDMQNPLRSVETPMDTYKSEIRNQKSEIESLPPIIIVNVEVQNEVQTIVNPFDRELNQMRARQGMAPMQNPQPIRRQCGAPVRSAGVAPAQVGGNVTIVGGNVAPQKTFAPVTICGNTVNRNVSQAQAIGR